MFITSIVELFFFQDHLPNVENNFFIFYVFNAEINVPIFQVIFY